MGGKRGGYEEEEAISQTFFSPYTPRGPPPCVADGKLLLLS